MTVTYTQKTAASGVSATDGRFGFRIGTTDYYVSGWLGGDSTQKKFYKSTDNGATWTVQTDFLYEGHTFAAAVKGNNAYIVGSDVQYKTNTGDWNRSSNVFNGTTETWSQISADCGIQNRVLGQLCVLGDDFYLFGGQTTALKSDTVYDTVMKSTDDCATFTVINSNTRPQFKGGLHWGAVVVYRDLFWKIGGAIYDSNAVIREHDTAIYTSPDGVTWTYRCEFKGIGRHYHQLVVYNDKIWVLNGYNFAYGPNIADIWTVEFTDPVVTQTRIGDAGYSARHALSAWVTPGGILITGGSTNANTATDDVWLITES